MNLKDFKELQRGDTVKLVSGHDLIEVGEVLIREPSWLDDNNSVKFKTATGKYNVFLDNTDVERV